MKSKRFIKSLLDPHVATGLLFLIPFFLTDSTVLHTKSVKAEAFLIVND